MFAFSKLRSDRIATYDERATILDRPPQQHFAKRNAPRFNGNHQAGKGPLQDTASLAQRFGVQVANQDSSRQVRPSTQMPARGQGQARSRLDTSSLLGRLGGAARRDEDMMDTS